MKTIGGRSVFDRVLRCLIVASLAAVNALVFVVSSDYPDATVQGRQFAFWLLVPCCHALALPVLLVGKSFRFRAADLPVLVFALYCVLQFYLTGSVAENRLFTFLLLIDLYYLLRLFQSYWPRTREWALLTLCLAGIFQAAIGLRQIYGFSPSFHPLYAITGTLFNPGPYGGYMAVVCCISGAYLLKQYRPAKSALGKRLDFDSFGTLLLYAVAMLACILSFIVLPSTLSRSAWMGVLVAGAGFAAMEYPPSGIFRKLYRRDPRRFSWMAAALVALSIAGIVSLYQLKPGSAHGRLLAWEVTGNAIAGAPVWGVGTGRFGGAYADSQAELFRDGRLSPDEIQVADCPTYAFNEYLQIGLEQGIVGLLLFLAIFIPACRGKSPDDRPWRCGLIALLVFAFTSYPFRVLPLQLSLVLMIGMGSARALPLRPVAHRMGIGVIWLLFAFVCVQVLVQRPVSKRAYREWKSVQVLYQMQFYEDLAGDYASMAASLQQEPSFLFEYGHTLNKTGDYEKSNDILWQGHKMSSDPMFLNIIGNNYKELEQYDRAAACYRYAFEALPNRIYPLYLLAKLYRESGDSIRMVDYARQVVDFIPKVESPATAEMKSEAETMLPGYDR